MVYSPSKKSAFTLVELLVVIAIIGLISTLAIVSLQSNRAKSRDVKRLSDIKQIQTSLEIYYADNKQYPETLNNSISSGSKVYLAKIPSAPTPPDGDCSLTDNDYTYETQGSRHTSYTINFCLGSGTGQLTAGPKVAVPVEITDPAYVWKTVGPAGFTSGATSPSYNSSIFIDNGIIYMSFIDNPSQALKVMRYNGSSWDYVGSSEGISVFGLQVYGMKVFDGIPYVFYSYNSSGSPASRVKKFNNATNNWDNVGSDLNGVFNLNLFFYNNELYFSYLQGYTNFFVMKYEDGDWQALASLPVEFSYPPNLVFHQETPYLIYGDPNNSYKLTALKFNGSNWEAMGDNHVFNIISFSYKLLVDNYGNFFVLTTVSNETKMFQYVNNSWIELPATDLSNVFSAFAYNGGVYLVDPSMSLKKYNGSSWENVGDINVLGQFHSLYVYKGTPYITFRDYDHNNEVTVMKYAP